LKANDVTIHPKAKDYRAIASQLAKRHRILFDPKQHGKKAAIMRWFSEHWDILGDQSLFLLTYVVSQRTPENLPHSARSAPDAP
jgi:hypothetical protein